MFKQHPPRWRSVDRGYIDKEHPRLRVCVCVLIYHPRLREANSASKIAKPTSYTKKKKEHFRTVGCSEII